MGPDKYWVWKLMDPTPTVSTSNPPSQYDYEHYLKKENMHCEKEEENWRFFLEFELLTGFVITEAEFNELERSLNYLPKFKS